MAIVKVTESLYCVLGGSYIGMSFFLRARIDSLHTSQVTEGLYVVEKEDNSTQK